MSDHQRLFFALWPDDALRSELAKLGRKSLRSCGGRLVPVANLHLTLLFLGSLDHQQRACMEQGAGRIEAEVFALELGGCEFWKRPRVVGFTASETPDPLRELVARLRQLGRDCGVPVESRPFVPHLTVMRKAQREPRPELQVSLNWVVRRFVLVHSRTLPEGAQYEIIGSWELVK